MKSLFGRFVLWCAVTTATFGDSNANANILQNGSFENPSITNPNNSTQPPNGITDWTVVPGPNGADIGLYNGNLVAAGYTFPAESGNQWVDLTGTNDPGPGGAVEQTVTLAAGTYLLSFYQGLSGVFGETSTTVDLLLNGTLVQSFTNSTLNGTGMSWQLDTYRFSTSGPVTIEFRSADPAGSSGHAVNGLDNVSLNAVPEPTSLAVAGIGAFSLISTALRRRRMKAV